jgi:DNA-binding LacI/PurR family transcriptional regulator
LNGRGRVDERTRARVREVARDMGYTANRNAQMLRSGRSGTLALLNSLPTGISEELSGLEYQAWLIMGATTKAMSLGYSVVTFPLSPQPGDIEMMVPDGAVLVDPSTESGVLEWLEDRGIPVVTTGRHLAWPPDRGWRVESDIADGAYRVLKLMEAEGARHIALLTNPPTRSYTRDSIDAYMTWARESGIKPRIVTTEPVASQRAAVDAALALFDDNPPDGLYAPLERLALGGMIAARTRGLRIPEDVLIGVGSDNEAARSADPSVTALDLQPYRVGELAIELLVQRIAGDEANPRHILVPVELRVRGSTQRRSRSLVS